MTNLPPGMEFTRHHVLDAEGHVDWCELYEDKLFEGDFICREKCLRRYYFAGRFFGAACAEPLDPSATFCPGCGATRWDISLPGDPMLTGWAPSERECSCADAV